MTAAGIPTPPAPRAWHMYRTLVGVGLACGALIVTVFEATRPIIRRNRIEARQRAILRVLPGASSSRTFRLAADGRFAPAPDDSAGDGLVFAGYDRQRELCGVAIEARGMGYQDVVRVLYGYSFAQQAVYGLAVLESKETPGLGDRVETDADYVRNFERLDVTLDASGERLAHDIEFVKQGQKTSPWQIDGITGATITSRAIADMLAGSAAHWIPQVVRRRADFAGQE